MSETNVNSEHWGVPAIISYLALLIFALTVSGVFLVIFKHNGPIQMELVAQVAGILGVETTLISGVVGYWLGSSSSAKTANAAVAQIAGVGPNPPSPPQV